MTLPTFQLRRNAFGRLVFQGADGQAHEGVLPVRAFPISQPGRGLSLVTADGHELLWIDQLADLPADARALVEEELASREFMPESASSRACRPSPLPPSGRSRPTGARRPSRCAARKTSAA